MDRLLYLFFLMLLNKWVSIALANRAFVEQAREAGFVVVFPSHVLQQRFLQAAARLGDKVE